MSLRLETIYNSVYKQQKHATTTRLPLFPPMKRVPRLAEYSMFSKELKNLKIQNFSSDF